MREGHVKRGGTCRTLSPDGSAKSDICLARWMQHVVPGDVHPLSVLFPGTHNSGTEAVNAPVIANWSRCQNRSVAEQLAMGVRLLDLRICDDVRGDAQPLWISHRVRSQPLLPVVKSVKSFLAANAEELLVLRIEKDYDRQFSFPSLLQLKRILEEELGDFIISRGTLTNSKLTVAHMRAKGQRLILVADEIFHRIAEESGCAAGHFVNSVWMVAKPSWMCTRGRKGEVVYNNICRYLERRKRDKGVELCAPTHCCESRSFCNDAQIQCEAVGKRKQAPSPQPPCEPQEDKAGGDVERSGRKLSTDSAGTRATESTVTRQNSFGVAGIDRRHKPDTTALHYSSNFYILEAILTHELESVAKHPWASIHSENLCMHERYLPLILQADLSCVHAVTCDFILPSFVKSIIQINQLRFGNR